MARNAAMVTITVPLEGDITSDFQRFVGPGCIQIGQQLQVLLAEFGVENVDTRTTLKPDYFLSSPSTAFAVSQIQQGAIDG